jgi:hypothetical protein
LKVNDKELSKNLLLGNLAQKLLAVPYKPWQTKIVLTMNILYKVWIKHISLPLPFFDQKHTSNQNSNILA